MQDQIRTLIRQAQGFIRTGAPKEALPLLEQAQTLARGDRQLRARITFQQAVAYELLGGHGRVLSLARESVELDPAFESQIHILATECENRGKGDLARDLQRLVSPEVQAVVSTGKSGRRIPWVTVMIAVTGAVVGGGIFYGSYLPDRQDSADASRFDIDRIRKNVGLVIVSAEYQAVDGSSLTIPLATGSCFAISRDGFLLTNKHVIQVREQAPERLEHDGDLIALQRHWQIIVCFGPDEKQHLEARIIYESPYRDVALLRVEATFPRHLKLARDPQPGDAVYAVGFPGRVSELLNAMDPADFWKRSAERISAGELDSGTWAFGEADYSITVTRGVIGAKHRVDEQNWVQHDAVVSGGSSGGALVTPSCRVVGMNTLKHPLSEGFNMALTLRQLEEELSPFLDLE